jgi:hypothetical protein
MASRIASSDGFSTLRREPKIRVRLLPEFVHLNDICQASRCTGVENGLILHKYKLSRRAMRTPVVTIPPYDG